MNKHFTLEFEIYTYQIDFSGHVSNIVYIQWLESARVKFLERIGISIVELEKQEILPILVETQIEYKKELRFGDSVRLIAWISELGNASAWVEYRILRNSDSAVCASARQRGLFIHGRSRRPARFTPEQKSLFLDWLNPTGESNGQTS